MNLVVRIVDKHITVNMTPVFFLKGVVPDSQMKEAKFLALLTKEGRASYFKLVAAIKENKR